MSSPVDRANQLEEKLKTEFKHFDLHNIPDMFHTAMALAGSFTELKGVDKKKIVLDAIKTVIKIIPMQDATRIAVTDFVSTFGEMWVDNNINVLKRGSVYLQIENDIAKGGCCSCL